MKKKMLILALVLVSITGFSFAADVPSINNNVLVSFNREFSSAQDVKWETNKNFIKVSFSMNHMMLFAYYSTNGELLAISRFISPDQLPLQLSTTLKKEYANYWISDLFEIHNDNGTAYYITIENETQKKVLMSSDSSFWTTYLVIDKQ